MFLLVPSHSVFSLATSNAPTLVQKPMMSPIPSPAASPQPVAIKKIKQVVFIFDATAMLQPFFTAIEKQILGPLLRFELIFRSLMFYYELNFICHPSPSILVNIFH